MAFLKWLSILIAVTYLGGICLLYFKQRAMLFPIPPVGRTAPAEAGLPEAEEHVLSTADGEKVIVWHVPAKPGHPVILFFHGNGDFLAGRISRFKAVTADGTGLVALSFRGYAGSSGTPSEQGLLLDGTAAYAFTAARYEASRIVAWGFSLGWPPRMRWPRIAPAIPTRSAPSVLSWSIRASIRASAPCNTRRPCR